MGCVKLHILDQQYKKPELQVSCHNKKLTSKNSVLNPCSFLYHLRDHLGSVRVAFTPSLGGGQGEAAQEIAYYPFGAPIAALSWSNQLSNPNRYMREGMEYISDFGWNKSDHGARYFDYWRIGGLSRDPLAAKYYWISPYALFANNPLKYADPDGRKLRPSSEFLASPYGKVYQKLQTNQGYMKIVGKYVKSTVYNIDYGVKEKSLKKEERAAETGASWNIRETTINGKTTSQYTYFDSKQDYFEVGFVQEGRSLTEIGKAATIIHEGLHSYLSAEKIQDKDDHENFMNYRTMMVDALMEYSNTNNLGFSLDQITDLSYSGIDKNNSQFQNYIRGFVNENTTYEEALNAYIKRVSDMVWTIIDGL